jgi:hypothetical protein
MPTAPVNGTASLGEDGVLHIDIHGPLSGDRVFFEVGDVISVTGAGGTIEGVVTPASEKGFACVEDPLPCSVETLTCKGSSNRQNGTSSTVCMCAPLGATRQTVEDRQTLSHVLATHDPLFVECTVALSGSVHTFTRIE